MRRPVRLPPFPACAGLTALLLLCVALCQTAAAAATSQEYRLKAALLFNFALFTEWPTDVGPTLTLCVDAPDVFLSELDALKGRSVGRRQIGIKRLTRNESLEGCQLIFVGASADGRLDRVLTSVVGRPVLTVAETPGATQRGVMLNMTVTRDRVTFEANARAARATGIGINSKLLRLATEVVN